MKRTDERGSATQPVSFRPAVVIAGIVFFLLVSGAFAFLGVEVAYRVYLYNRYAANFSQPPEASTFSFFRDSVWTFDREVGYRYKPNHSWLGGFVQDGRLVGCDSSSRTDAFGNMGLSGVDYADAEVKVLVFGDSVTMQPSNNVTYPSLLETALSKRLGRRVSIVNFGRDGYGILQMIDLAVREIPHWRPDIVLIDFITDDIDRDRFWRTEMSVGGRLRVFTTTEPDPEPRPTLRVDTMLLEPLASQDWCNRVSQSKQHDADPVMRHLLEGYRIATADASRKPRLWGFDYSTVAETIRSGDPFAFVWRRLPATTSPRVNRDHYDDARLVDGLKTLKSFGVPIYYIHLPVHAEIKANTYQLTNHKTALLSDLELLLGSPVLKNLRYIKVEPQDVDRIRINPMDGAHPSVFGMEVYANSLVDLLYQNGALAKWMSK
jgi:GDSL-like Lipase/Acylhydrolase